MQISRGQYSISDEGGIVLIPESQVGYEGQSLGEAVVEVSALTVPRRRPDSTQRIVLTVTVCQLSFHHLDEAGVFTRALIDLYLEDFFWENDFHPKSVHVKDQFTFSCELTRNDGSSFSRRDLKWLYKGLKEHGKDRYTFHLAEYRNEQEALLYEG